MKLKRTNKLLALLLTLVMVVGLLPTMALADDSIATITYTNNGETASYQVTNKIADLNVLIGKSKKSAGVRWTGSLYLAELPAGATINDLVYCNGEYSNEFEAAKIAYSSSNNQGSGSTFTNCIANADNYMKNDDFRSTATSGNYYTSCIQHIPSDVLASTIQLIPNQQVKGFFVRGFYQTKQATKTEEGTGKEAIIIVQISTADSNGSQVNKTNLNESIATASALNPSDYYTENDRYNGVYSINKDTAHPTHGFWVDMQTALDVAQDVYINSNDATAVATAASNLNAAVAKLIPTSKINPTELYELTQAQPRMTEAQATARSWAAYTDALTNANTVLNKLYVTHELENSSSNETTTKAVSDATTKLQSAIAGLDDPVTSNMLPHLQAWYDLLVTLPDRWYNPALLNESDYTAASWKTFTDARAAAKTFTAAHPRPTEDFGNNEATALKTAYANIRAAYDGLTETKDSITVTLELSDVLNSRGARFGLNDWPLEKNSYTVTLPDDRSIGKLLELTENPIAAWSRTGTGYGQSSVASTRVLFRNGQLIDPGTQTVNVGVADYYDSVVLRDKDVITLANLSQPIKLGSATVGYDPVYDATELYHFIRSASLNGPAELQAGAEGTYTATAMDAWLGDYTGYASAMAGAEVFVSPAVGASAETAVSASKKTDLTTDAQGKFTYGFYEKGWYTLSVYPAASTASDAMKTDTSGLTAGASILVYVTEADAATQAAAKARLQSELDAAYAAYPENYFTADAWSAIDAAYKTGTNGIKNGATLADSKAAQTAALHTITRNQNDAARVNANALESFRYQLGTLPDDVGKLTKNEISLMQELVRRYDALSGYAKEHLTSGEAKKYNDLLKAYGTDGSGLPAGRTYALNWTWSAADAADTAVLTAVFAKEAELNLFCAKPFSFHDQNGYLVSSDTAAPNINSAFQFTDPLSGLCYEGVDKLNAVVAAVDGFTVTTNPLKFIVNEREYEIKSATLNGEALPNVLRIGASMFDMPYGDVTAAVVYGPVEAVDPTVQALAAAKRTALAKLKTEYEKCTRKDYSAENWTKLVQAYEAGVSNINSAGTTDAVEKALGDAKNAMGRVPKEIKEEGAISGWGENSVFDAGKQVGTVTVSGWNETFEEGAFTGKLFEHAAYPLGANDTMMTVILRALYEAGYTWNGTVGEVGSSVNASDFTISYLATIHKDGKTLGEFSGEPGSGWMGSLNDFMVNEGFPGFTVKNNQLADGDEIKLMFTQNLGEDLGGTWGNSDTTLKDLKVSAGEIIPAFTPGKAGGQYDFALMISGSRDDIKITPTATNKNYMVKTFLNEKVTDNDNHNSYYKRTEAVPVRVGDVIWIGVGEKAWPSMNSYGAEARAYTATWYALHVISADSGADYVNELIGKLPKVTYSNYKTVQAKIAEIEGLIAKLSSAAQAKVKTSELTAAKEKVTFYTQIDDVKAKLAALPKEARMSDEQIKAAKAQIEAAYAAYTALTEEQQGYITVGDAKNYNALVDRLSKLAPETSAQTIVGSDKKPEKDENEVAPAQVVVAPEVAADGTAKAEIAAEDVSKALEEAPDAKTLTVKVNTEGAASVEADLPADAVRAAADAGVGLNVETEQGTVKLSAADVKAASGKDLAVSVKSNADGTTSFEVSAGGTAVAANVKVELPAKDGQVLVIVNADGTEEVVKKCVTSDGKVYAEIPAGAKVKVADAQGMTFGDVKETDWFAGAVEFVTSRGIFQGTGDGFQPNAPMNRAMLVTVLQRIAGEKARGENTFGDVEPDAWYADAVIWASENGIVNGTDKGFEPDEPVTREQIATMLYRFMKYLGYDVSASKALSGFPDGGDASPWAKEAMEWAAGVGLFQGDQNGNLNPGGKATRAEVATLVERLIGLIVK